MIDASQRHKKNVQRLERTLNFLQEKESSDTETEQPSCVDLEFLEFITKWKDSRLEPVDYEMVSSCKGWGSLSALPIIFLIAYTPGMKNERNRMNWMKTRQ